MTFPIWLIDCDNTLYSAGTGFFDRVDRRITEYMSARMGFDSGVIESLRARYRDQYGVTLAGLMAEYTIDPDDYLSYVHDVKLSDLIGPDPVLSAALRALPGEKHIFTNGSREHAERVLTHLDIMDQFDAIYDIEFMDYVPKPRPHGYEKLLKDLGVLPGDCIMADDYQANLDTAKRLGMVTVKVGGTPSPEHLFAANAKDLAVSGAAALSRRL